MKKSKFISGGIAIGVAVIMCAATPAEAFSHNRHSIVSHGLAAGAGGIIGYMVGRSSNEHYNNTYQSPQTVVVERPEGTRLTDCSVTRRSPEIENDGYLHQVFIKDCVVQR